MARESVDFLWAGDGGSNQSRKPGPDVPDVPDAECLEVAIFYRFRFRFRFH